MNPNEEKIDMTNHTQEQLANQSLDQERAKNTTDNAKFAAAKKDKTDSAQNTKQEKSAKQSYASLRKDYNDQRLAIATEKKMVLKDAKLKESMDDNTFLALEPNRDRGQILSAKIIELQRRILDLDNHLGAAILIEPSRIHENVDSAEELLVKKQCGIYKRSGGLVKIINAAQAIKHKRNKLNRDDDAAVIADVDQIYLSEVLTKYGRWIKLDERGKIRQVGCPDRISQNLIARKEWPSIQPLSGIISAPTLRSDGSILSKHGYDAECGIFLIDDGEEYDIPESPTPKDARNAMSTLEAMLVEFPFESPEGKSVVLSAILTALIRKSIDYAPMHGFTAYQMRSGKTLLCDIISIIATGNHPTTTSYMGNEAEDKKKLHSMCMAGDEVICYDNVSVPFKGDFFCLTLTSSRMTERILGRSQTASVPTNVLLLVNGNNLTFAEDITSRTLLCKLKPDVERPEERTFVINDLRKHVRDNRSRFVSAALTALRAFYVAGKPIQDIKPYGGFEEWSNLVRSTLVWLGYADPCDSRREIESADPVRINLRKLLSSWWSIYPDKAVKLKEVIDSANGRHENSEALLEAFSELAPDQKNGININALGQKLSGYIGRIEDGYSLQKAGASKKITLWMVAKIEVTHE